MLRTPKCSRCQNHGYLVPVKGHAGKYRWKQCICDKCYLISERQKIMAAQKMFKKQDTSEEQGAQLAPGGPREAADPNPGEAADPDPEEAADPDPWEAANYDPGEAANPDPGEAANPISGLCTLPLASSGGPGPGPTTSSLERPPLVCSPGPNAFQPVLGNHPGPSTFQAALSESPPTWLPQLSSGAPRTEPCLPEQRLPLRLLPRLPFPNYGHPVRFNSDHVSAGYPDREPVMQYPACCTAPSCQSFPLGYQDASPSLGMPSQRDFRHTSYSPYCGGDLVPEPGKDFQPRYYSPPPPLPLPPPPPPLRPPVSLPPLLSPLPPLPPLLLSLLLLPQLPPLSSLSQPRQPQFLPPGYLSGLHFLPHLLPPPSPPTSSLTIQYGTDKENTDDQNENAVVPTEPSQLSSQEQSN